ncbi:UPF0317 protein YcsI [Olavius algarvensis Delta 1 endosymbiont]|nr:UPF0317 protein YcsI [Olavius algarvensis Delta 1 endosymbiont]
MGGTAYTPEAARKLSREARLQARRGELADITLNLAPGIVQGNVAILPKDWAADFLKFCWANPKPCPLLAVSEAGDPMIFKLGEDIDIRTDLPMYRVFREGVMEKDVRDIRDLWQDDFVTFVLGCSFSFDEALRDAGIPPRHFQLGISTAMYRTNIEAVPAGPFKGSYVVSMRPYKPAAAIRAIQVTSRFPNVHGAPLHFGDPQRIGIEDITKPDFGDCYPVYDGEVPVFWACGVTPQVIIEQAKPPICITHKPSHMLLTDLLNAELAML